MIRLYCAERSRLQTDEIDEIKARMQELTRRRVEKQPVDKASAGSTFKRPEGYYAAALIEESGLKGYSHGGASVRRNMPDLLLTMEMLRLKTCGM